MKNLLEIYYIDSICSCNAKLHIDVYVETQTINKSHWYVHFILCVNARHAKITVVTSVIHCHFFDHNRVIL